MIRAGLVLLICQLAGTVLGRALGLPFPGPVIGLVLLLTLFAIRPALADAMRPTVSGLLAIMSLLFVPAGVGIVQHLGRFASEGVGLMVALFVSTALSIAVSALVFAMVARRTGAEAPDPQAPGGA